MSIRSYITGFLLSVGLTLLPVGLLWLHAYNHHHFPTHTQLAAAFIALAIFQLLVQLIFFLHVGREKSAWNSVALGFALFTIIVVVGGSLWIMQNLRHTSLTDEFIGGIVTPENQAN